MSNYFTNLPILSYDIDKNNKFKDTTNIFVRQKLTELVLSNASIYYTYLVKPKERPDIIAFNYYGSTDYTWIVLFSNAIIDPYFEWPLDEDDFKSHLLRKYGSISEARSTIHSYHQILRAGTATEKQTLIEVDETTYNSLSGSLRTTISKYDYEHEKNEEKRSINLIEDVYVANIQSELRRGI